MKLRIFLFIGLLVLGLLPLLLLAGLLVPGTLRELDQIAVSNSREVAAHWTSGFDDRLMRRKETARFLALQPGVRELLGETTVGLRPDLLQTQERLVGMVRRWFRGPADILAIRIIDPAWRVRLSLVHTSDGFARGPTADAVASDSAAARRATTATDGTAVVVWKRSGDAGASVVLRVFAAILKPDGQPAGFVVLDADVNDLLAGAAGVILADRAGQPLTFALNRGPTPTPGSGEHLSLAAVVTSELATAELKPLVSQAGGRGAIAWAPLRLDEDPSNALWIGVPSDQSEGERWLAAFRWQAIAIVLLVVIGTAGCAYWSAGTLDQYKYDLLLALGRMARGETSARLPWRWPSELRELATELATIGEGFHQSSHARQVSEWQIFQEKSWTDSTLGSIADGVIRVDDHERVMFANAEARRLLALDDVSGVNATAGGSGVNATALPLTLTGRLPLVYGEPPGVAMDALAECRKLDRTVRFAGDVRLIKSNSAAISVEVPVEVVVSPVHDSTGVTDGFVLMIRDVTVEYGLTQLLSYRNRHDAQNKGHNQVHVAAESDHEEVQRRSGAKAWAQRVVQAIEQDQFVLYRQVVQPLTEQSDDLLVEILVRMRDQDGQMILPGEFIAAAERYNQMRNLDRWVVERTICALAEPIRSHWQAAINLSAQSVADENMAGFILDRVAAARISPRRLCFEIPETAVIASPALALKFMSVLSAQGCRFTVDDFGSGLSSFGYPSTLPVECLKIDGLFVRDIVGDRTNRAIVEAMIRAAHAMSLKVIAKHVESIAICEEMVALGADYVQGYAIGMSEPV
ncbi:hypothetical protein WCLP8_2630001 [uncultured Gammaproteobacteria bacterium]